MNYSHFPSLPLPRHLVTYVALFGSSLMSDKYIQMTPSYYFSFYYQNNSPFSLFSPYFLTFPLSSLRFMILLLVSLRFSFCSFAAVTSCCVPVCLAMSLCLFVIYFLADILSFCLSLFIQLFLYKFISLASLQFLSFPPTLCCHFSSSLPSLPYPSLLSFVSPFPALSFSFPVVFSQLPSPLSPSSSQQSTPPNDCEIPRTEVT